VDSPPLPDGTVVRGTGILRCDGGTGVGSGVAGGAASFSAAYSRRAASFSRADSRSIGVP
jgi:hypothetical protein